MNVVELQRALRQLRCSGIAAGLEVRLLEAQAEKLAALDFLSRLVQDELVRRQDRLLERRLKQAGFRDAAKRLDTFDFDFNKKMNRALVFELATARWVTQHADALFLGPPGTGKSHVAQAIGFAAIQQGHRVLYREAHVLVEDLAEAQLAGTRKDYVAFVTTVPLLIIDDLGMRKLPPTAAEDLLEIVMRRYERASTLLTSNRPVEGLGQAPRRHRGRHRDARPAPPPRARAHVWAPELAHPAPQRAERALTEQRWDDASRFAAGRPRSPSRGYLDIPSSAPKTPTQGACSITIERGRRLALGTALLHWPVLPRPQLAGFQVSTEGHQQ